MKKLILAVLGLTIALPSMAMAETCEEFGVSCNKKGDNVEEVICSVKGEGYYHCDYECKSKIDIDAFTVDFDESVDREKIRVEVGASDDNTSDNTRKFFKVISNKSDVTSVTGSCGEATSEKRSDATSKKRSGVATSAKRPSEFKSLKAIEGPCGNEYLTKKAVDGVEGYIVHRYYVKSNNKFREYNFTNDYYCTDKGKHLKIQYDKDEKIWYATKNSNGKPECVDDYDVTADQKQHFCTQAYKKGEEPGLKSYTDLYQAAVNEIFLDTNNTCENKPGEEQFWFWIADNMPKKFDTEAEELKEEYKDECEKNLGGKIEESKGHKMSIETSTVSGTKYSCKCPGVQNVKVADPEQQKGNSAVTDSADKKDEINTDYSKLTNIVNAQKANKWRNKDGEFNTARLASDMTAGVVLGTAGALITSSLVKKSQVESGFEDIKCHISGQAVAEFGDEFTVGIK